ncbi:MAG: hypothetical protein KF768_10455 [Phycisphaeraceae bacterium]|nr:hypothetical protein [Phycisphaeraceae bacterium]
MIATAITRSTPRSSVSADQAVPGLPDFLAPWQPDLGMSRPVHENPAAT